MFVLHGFKSFIYHAFLFGKHARCSQTTERAIFQGIVDFFSFTSILYKEMCACIKVYCLVVVIIVWAGCFDLGAGVEQPCNCLIIQSGQVFSTWNKWCRFGRMAEPFSAETCSQILPGPSPAGGPVVPGPPFHVWPPVAAYVQYCIWKVWPPLLVFGPSIWFLAPLLLNPGDGSGYCNQQFSDPQAVFL